MKESGYYPPGAEFDPNAPWNQKEPSEEDFDVTCTQVLSKTLSISTTNYEEGVDEEYDEEGHKCKYPWIDTSNVDWEEEWSANDHHTPLQLLGFFKRYLEDMLNHTEKSPKHPSYLKHLIAECDSWDDDETTFTQD